MDLKFPHLIHGCDYNPDQWRDYPDILQKDVELMKEAHINCVSLGIFSWAQLEPQEGVYDLDWLEALIDNLYANGIYTVLATPSGARPLWMAHKYPEVLRVSKDLIRILPGARHNHCYTSPIYREKVREIDTILAKRFSQHPAVILWHLSNEHGGECYCPLCQKAFRDWLIEKYGSLDALNKAYWSDFWSHRYTDWNQIQPPVPNGEMDVHGLNLDWKRFSTYQTVDFTKWESDSVKSISSNLPVTTNHGEDYDGISYPKFKAVADITSWDSYPLWGSECSIMETGQKTAFAHDVMRSIKKQPFLLMESSPSSTNWQKSSRLRAPGIHMLASMQAVAHGSNSVQYFQWRKSRGSSEKLHGAVVDHCGTSDTRVFREVSAVGKRLEKLDSLVKTCPKPEVAIIYDWENGWAINDSRGPRNCGMHYLETVMSHHMSFWRQGIQTDVIDMENELDDYRLVVAPMLYLLRADFADKLKRFVSNGGTLVGTYWSGIVNEFDLCYLGGFPGEGLSELYGLHSEEIDGLYDGQKNQIEVGSLLKSTHYTVTELCELIHCTTAEPLGFYSDDFYKGVPALTSNQYKKGTAYYLAAHGEQQFLDDFAVMLADKLELKKALDAVLPVGVTATARSHEKESSDKNDIIFVQNFTNEIKTIALASEYIDWENDELMPSHFDLSPYEVRILIKQFLFY